MSLLGKLTEKNGNKKKKERKIDNKKLAAELPYFITIVTLLSSAGIGPYLILHKLKNNDLLPTVQTECSLMLKRMDLLGLDPLTVLSEAKSRTKLKEFGEFLDGYVTTMHSGGSVLNYLKSKMKSIFERYSETQKQSTNKVAALVDSYMTIQIVILAIYIITAAIGSQDSSDEIGMNDMILMVGSPLITVGFFILANKMTISQTPELDMQKIIRFAIPGFVISFVIAGLGLLDPKYIPFMIGGAFITASLWPAISFKNVYDRTVAAESATPKILRNITEARKTGMGPEVCVVQACKRKDYDAFNPIANGIARKLEWGVSLPNVFEYMKKEIKMFNVLISFDILFQLITSGGGNTQTLDSLAETSEKIFDIEKSKREMLKTFLIVGFILMGTSSFTTLLVTDSFGNVSEDFGNFGTQSIPEVESNSINLFPLIVMAQSWMAGLFLGKVITGAYSGGFQYAIVLVLLSLVGITTIEFELIDIGSVFGNAE